MYNRVKCHVGIFSQNNFIPYLLATHWFIFTLNIVIGLWVIC